MEVEDSILEGPIDGRSGALRRRALTTASVLGQSLAIGAIFSAGFLSGTVAVFAGFNTPLSVLLAAVGMVALAYVVSMYARRFAGAGAVYEYLVRGTHLALGIVGRGLIWGDCCSSAPAEGSWPRVTSPTTCWPAGCTSTSDGGARCWSPCSPRS